MTPVRILVADDHEVVREGLRILLQSHSGWKICGEATTGREAVQKAKQLRPDVVILDFTMPELNGLEATRKILKAAPKTEVLIFTYHESDQVLRGLLDAGARGYVLKSDSAQDLVIAVETLSQHKPFFSSKLSEVVLKNVLDKQGELWHPTSRFSSLSPREREVVQLVAEGKSSKQAAATLGICAKTVEYHRTNAMRKLHVHSISELVHYAIRNKIVEL